MYSPFHVVKLLGLIFFWSIYRGVPGNTCADENRVSVNHGDGGDKITIVE